MQMSKEDRFSIYLIIIIIIIYLLDKRLTDCNPGRAFCIRHNANGATAKIIEP